MFSLPSQAATPKPTSRQITFGAVSDNQMQVAGGVSRKPRSKNQRSH